MAKYQPFTPNEILTMTKAKAQNGGKFPGWLNDTKYVSQPRPTTGALQRDFQNQVLKQPHKINGYANNEKQGKNWAKLYSTSGIKHEKTTLQACEDFIKQAQAKAKAKYCIARPPPRGGVGGIH
jgi:hypothetical protein